MRFTVGGEEYDLTKERVISAMRGVPSEPIQKHVVEVGGVSFPPKQVFATVTGRQRTSFTTMEAQRVLRRLGFVCRPAGRLDGVSISRSESDGPKVRPTVELRLEALEGTVATVEAAIAGLHARVKELEAGR